MTALLTAPRTGTVAFRQEGASARPAPPCASSARATTR